VILAAVRTAMPIQALDHWVYLQACALVNLHGWLWAWMGVTSFGYGEFVVPTVSLVLLLGLARQRNLRWFLVIAVCWLAFEANPYLKHLFHSDRPTTLLDAAHLASYSFPSGHAFNAVLLFYLVPRLLVLQKPGAELTRRWFLTVWFYAPLILAIGLSRIFLGAHWVSDVVGGTLHGFFWAELMLIILLSPTNAAKEFENAQNQTLSSDAL
jgi:membrane-associated phospholipid phosphatase